MKKLKCIPVILVLFCITTSVTAQTKRGRFMIGGTTDLSIYKTSSKWKTDDDDGETESVSGMQFTPCVGYFIVNGLAVGLKTPLSSTKVEDKEGEYKGLTTKTKTYIWEPFVTYYIGSTDIKPFVHAGIGDGSILARYEYKDDIEEISGDVFLYEVSAGFAVFFLNTISAELAVGYSSTTVQQIEYNEDHYKTIDSGLSFDVGVVFMF